MPLTGSIVLCNRSCIPFHHAQLLAGACEWLGAVTLGYGVSDKIQVRDDESIAAMVVLVVWWWWRRW